MNDSLEELDRVALEIVKLNKNTPLLVMYYDDPAGSMEEVDVAALYDTFRAEGATTDEPYERLFVLLHTNGGDPDTSYRLAQVLCDFAKEVTFLVPYYAVSAGTLLCLCSKSIWLGAYAILGPIDLKVDDVELASIEFFRKFVLDTKNQFEQDGERKKEGEDEVEEERISGTDVDSDMMVEMTKQVGALEIGALYRRTTLTTKYASKLMRDYMFAHLDNGQDLADEVAERLVREFPAHDFVLDYHMCQELKLPVKEMKQELSDSTKQLVDRLDILVENKSICRDQPKYNGEDYKSPFFRLYVVGNRGGREKA